MSKRLELLKETIPGLTRAGYLDNPGYEIPHVDAIIVQQDELFVVNRAMLIHLAAQRRLPGMFVFSLYPQAGGLMSYGANAAALHRRAAEYVHRILKGARPSDLPAARPTQV